MDMLLADYFQEEIARQIEQIERIARERAFGDLLTDDLVRRAFGGAVGADGHIATVDEAEEGDDER